MLCALRISASRMLGHSFRDGMHTRLYRSTKSALDATPELEEFGSETSHSGPFTFRKVLQGAEHYSQLIHGAFSSHSTETYHLGGHPTDSLSW